MSDNTTAALDALERVFSLDSSKGAVVIRSTPRFMAEEVIRELRAQGWTLTHREVCDPPCAECCTVHPHWTHLHGPRDLGELLIVRNLPGHLMDEIAKETA